MDNSLLTAAAALRAAPRVVVATGAGMPHESGIPTVRDAVTGLWAQYAPEELATEPPACPRCGAPVRPDVVWFGEMVPKREAVEAWQLAAACQVLLVVGTSGLVHPAAQLPYIARDAGATVVEINPEPTEISAVAQITCRGPAGAILPAMVSALEGFGEGA